MARIVLKFGTGTLSRSAGRALDARQFRHIAAEISLLVKAGHSCVIVSSAAIAAGVHMLRLDHRPEDLSAKQACAAAGQPELMRMYASAFRRHGLIVAQLLLTHDDIDSRMRRQNAFNTIKRILEAGNIVPIINENDTVAVEELRVGDNDRLSAEVAQLVNAEILLLLTSSDGLSDSEGRRIAVAENVSEVLQHVRPETGEMSVGGMRAKLQAVDFAISHGICTCILDGRKAGQIAAALQGKNVGTRFVVPRRRRLSRRSGFKSHHDHSDRCNRAEHLHRTHPTENLLHPPCFRRWRHRQLHLFGAADLSGGISDAQGRLFGSDVSFHLAACHPCNGEFST